MKLKITLFSLMLIVSLLIIAVSGNNVYSDDNGAPAMVSGSPFDGQTCAKSTCHTGNAVTVTPGIINSNIPASGYVAGSIYTITATLSQTGNQCWGFEISPQTPSGVLLGTPIITNATTTKVVSLKWVTHKLAGTTGTDTKTWSFDWIAPAAGTGNVTFYGAFNVCNNNGLKTGDFIHTSTMTVNEFTVGTSENSAVKAFSIYPNPVQVGSQFSFYLDEPSDVKMTMASVNGSMKKTLCEEKNVSGSYIYTFDNADLNAGLYIVSLETQRGVFTRKIVVI
jgi:hypothetical protein